jgi:sugar diacid utilization regulator
LSSMRRSLKKIAIEQDKVIIKDNRRNRIAELMIKNRELQYLLDEKKTFVAYILDLYMHSPTYMQCLRRRKELLSLDLNSSKQKPILMTRVEKEEDCCCNSSDRFSCICYLYVERKKNVKIAVASASVFILSTNNFHDDFLIKPERRWLKTP